jgi:peroxiredoxin
MKNLMFCLCLVLATISCKKEVTNPNVVPAADAPEITLNDANGKAINLSSLKGKVVVLSFWASWCPGCRASNPELVKLYNNYKSKGLEVYSVSLDTDKAAWQKAVKDDGLIWTNHVTDLKKWSSKPVTDYNVQSTPYKVLIDKNGKIAVLNFTPSMTAEVDKLL